MKLSFTILQQIVDRCHVSASSDKVVSYAISRLKQGQKTFDSMSSVNQEKFMQDCKKIHRANQKMYLHVMKGF
jgi:hypothetical protein